MRSLFQNPTNHHHNHTSSPRDNTASSLPPKMSFVPVNPRPMLQGLVDKDIVVRLKWGETEYKGKLVSLDSYLNLQLAGTVEYINGKATGELGQVLIRCGCAPSAGWDPRFWMATNVVCCRCNNVLWIRGADQGEGADTKMED